MRVELARNAVSFRIATLPCRGGEKVVFKVVQQVVRHWMSTRLECSDQLAKAAHALQQPRDWCG